MRKSTLIGWMSELGGSPLASSIAVIPSDHMSAWGQDGRREGDGKEEEDEEEEEEDLGVIGRLLYDLRGHPERCTHKGESLHGVGELASHTKISQLYLTILRQEDISS